MSLTPVQDAIDSVKCGKAVDRRRGIKDLANLLSDRNIIKVLDRNSSQSTKDESITTWTSIFKVVVDNFDKEAASAKDTDYGETVRSQAFQLVQQVIRVANRITSRPYLDVNVLHKFLIKRIKNLGNYSSLEHSLLLLIRGVLRVPLYTSLMKSQQWIDTLEALLFLLGRNNRPLKSQILETFNTAIELSSDEPAVIRTLRTKVLEFYKSSMLNRKDLNEHNELYVKGFLSLCKNNAIEFRQSLCQVGEAIIPALLCWIEVQIDDGDTKATMSSRMENIYEVFLAQLKLHVPRDADHSSSGFYVHGSLNDWSNIIRKLYTFSLDSIQMIAYYKSRQRTSTSDMEIPKNLLLLAVKCTKQISQLPTTTSENEDDDDDQGTSRVFTVSSPKKRKMFKNFNESICETCHMKNIWEQSIWLSYITAVLREYPALIGSESNFSSLMQTAMNIFNSNMMPSNSPHIFSLLQVLLKCEKYLLSNKNELQPKQEQSELVQKKNASWNYIWSNIVRYFSLNESECELAEQVLQDILVEWRPANLDSLLSLYLNNSFPITKSRLNLLRDILLNCSLPVTLDSIQLNCWTDFSLPSSSSSTTCPRFLLLKWLYLSPFQDEQQHEYNFDTESENLMYALQISLLASKTHKVLATKIKEEEEYRKQRMAEKETFGNYDFEDILMMTSFEAPFPLPLSDSNNLKLEDFCDNIDSSLSDSRTGGGVLTSAITISTYLQFLDEYHLNHFLPSEFDIQNEVSLRRTMRKICFHIKSYIQCLNFFDKFSSVNKESELENKMTSLLSSSLTLLFNKVNEFLSKRIEENNDITEENYDLLSFVISLQSSVIESRSMWCDKVKSLIVRKFPQNLLENIFTILDKAIQYASGRNECEDDEADVETKGDRNQRICIEIFQLLCNYGLHISDNRLAFFQKIIKYCTDLQFSVVNQRTFDMSAELVSCLIPMISKTPALITSVLDLVQRICRAYFMSKSCTLRIWKILADFIPAIVELPSGPSQSDGKRHFMVLLGSLTNFLQDQGFQTCQMAFRTMEKLAQNDRNLSWSWFEPKGKRPVDKIYPLLDVYSYLKIPSHRMVLSVLRVIFSVFDCHRLYSTGSSMEESISISNITESNKKIEDFFQLVYGAISNLFELPNYSPAEVDELKHHCTSTTLLCLSHIIFISPLLQECALFRFFQLVNSKSIDVKLCHKALKQAHPNAFEIIKLNIPVVLENWLDEGLSIEVFPYQLLNFEDVTSFRKEYEGVVVIKLFELGQTGELENFSTQCETTVQNLVEKHFCRLLARHSVSLCASPSTTGYSLSMDSNPYDPTNRSNARIIAAIGEVEEFQNLIETNPGEIILEQCFLLEFSKDVAVKWGCYEFNFPHGTSHDTEQHHKYRSMTEEGFLKSLTLLSQSIAESGSSSSLSSSSLVLDYLAKHSPQTIHKMLLSLAKRVHEAAKSTLLHHKLSKLYHFSFFVSLLMNSQFSTFKLTKGYSAPFIIQAYLRFLSKAKEDSVQEESFLRAVFLSLHDFLVQLIKESPREVKPYYNEIVYNLTKNILKHPRLLDTIKLTLNLLLIEQKGKFSSIIASLDPFPNTSPTSHFAEYRKIHEECSSKKLGEEGRSLSGKLSLCLQQMRESKGYCTKERLQFLRKLLVDGKDEFKVLVKDLEEKGLRFHDECQEYLVHNLVGALVRIIQTTNNNNFDLDIEAAKCLGQVGPVNLQVLVLPSYEKYDRHQNKVTENTNGDNTKIGQSLIDRILEYTYEDEDIELSSTAGEVLSSLFSLKEFQNILKTDSQYSASSRNYSLLKPFISSTKRLERKEKLIHEREIAEKFKDLYTNDENFSRSNYSDWIVKLTCTLISCFSPQQESLVQKLAPLCSYKVEFCEEVLPFIIYCMLETGKSYSTMRTGMTNYFENFFSKFSESTLTDNGDSVYRNQLAIRCLLKVVQYLRLHDVPEEFKEHELVTPWDNNFWLKLNYMNLSQAAQYFGDSLSCILYLEIFSAEKELCVKNVESQSINISDDAEIDEIEAREMTRSESFNVFKLLLKAYTSIGEEDSVFGCGSARFSDFESRIQHLEQLQCWHQILSAYDAEGQNMGFKKNSLNLQHPGICKALKNLGLYNILWTNLQGIRTRDDGTSTSQHDVEDIWYECGWRLSKWDINSNKVQYLNDDYSNLLNIGQRSGTFQKHIYKSIQAGIRKETSLHNKSIEKGFQVVIEDLKHASLESSENLYNFLTKFKMLQIIENTFKKKEQPENINTVIDIKFTPQSLQRSSIYADFKYSEPILYLTKTLMNTSVEKKQKFPVTSSSSSSALNHHLNIESTNYILLDLITSARNSNCLELAEKYTSEIIEPNSHYITKRVEIAKNYWARGNQDISKHILQGLINDKQFLEGNHQYQDLYPTLLILFGEWLYERMEERPTTIFRDYFIKACGLIGSRSDADVEEISHSHLVVAKYADAQYQKLLQYIQSDLFVKKLVLSTKHKEEQEKIATTRNVDDDTNNYAVIMKKQSDNDTSEITQTLKEKHAFRILALKQYLKALKRSDKYDTIIFRCVALWLESSPTGNDDGRTGKIIDEEELPPHKFINVLHQISARMGSSDAQTNEIITKIIMKCGEVHPYHTIPIIMTQAKLNKDKEIQSKSKKALLSYSGEERMKAAKSILEKFKKNSNIRQISLKTEVLWDALIDFANNKDESQSKKFLIPEKSAICSITKMEEIPVPTTSIPISQSGTYTNFIGIHSFDKYYYIVGGKNKPKRITCIGTNGQKYSMLLKGNDDLRQDAVMQQVFTVMNTMLSQERKTKKRRLLMRVYKVVPLSQRSGVLEWCENTQTIGEYLSGNGSTTGAHHIYRPLDYKVAQCRNKMQEVQNCGDSKKKIAVFTDIIEHFKPVFRHFFFEKFKDPGSFFEKRLAYTRSVATSSMIGFILGLGDRHVGNILMDKTTAEVIHIDLGIAFDQGQHLAIPERIPFRLTRDIVDGMGVCQIEGVFRRSCEMTLEVLRKNSDIILTILEVLLYDPLYIWTLTEDRKCELQPTVAELLQCVAGTSRGSVTTGQQEDVSPQQQNNSAARELRRLRCKLAGLHEGSSSGTSMSLEGQVSLLIQNAMDLNILAKIYCGWQPYL